MSTYVVEYAKSDRSKCMACKGTIGKVGAADGPPAHSHC